VPRGCASGQLRKPPTWPLPVSRCSVFQGIQFNGARGPFSWQLCESPSFTLSHNHRVSIFSAVPKTAHANAQLFFSRGLQNRENRLFSCGRLFLSPSPTFSETVDFPVFHKTGHANAQLFLLARTPKSRRSTVSSCGKLFLSPSPTFECGRGQGEGSGTLQRPHSAPPAGLFLNQSLPTKCSTPELAACGATLASR
jgi:hypothetical protein